MREFIIPPDQPDGEDSAIEASIKMARDDHERMSASNISGAYSRQLSIRSFGDATKRAFDISVSLLALIPLLPFFVLIGLWIRRVSPGPVFYKGRRAAKGGGIFYILKFRTMYECPESYQGLKVTGCDDPRITPAGRWLRQTKLNELPQVWNVLKGEMSLVGPRPEDPDIVNTWPKQTRQEILSIRPGITSPASVLFRKEEELLGKHDVMNTYMKSIVPSKMRLDQLYVRHRSFWLDLDVLLWTLLVVLIPGLGSAKAPEEYLFWGPVSRLIRRHLSWFSVDALIALVAFVVVGLYWHMLHPLFINLSWTVMTAAVFTLVFSLTGALLGLNRIAWSKARAVDIFDLVPPAALATVVVLGANSLLGIFPASFVLLACLLAISGYVTVRYRLRLITGMALRLARIRHGPKTAQERVLIVGCGQAGEVAVSLLNAVRRNKAFRLIGFVDDDLYKQDMRIKGVQVIGQCKDIPRLVERHDVGVILFAIHNISPEVRQRLLDICHQTQSRVFQLPDFLGMLDATATHDEIGEGSQPMTEPSGQSITSVE